MKGKTTAITSISVSNDHTECRVRLTAKFETAQDSISSHQGRVENELEETTEYPIQREDGANLARLETKAAIKVERELGVYRTVFSHRIVQKHRHDLVEGDRVKSQDGIRNQVDCRLPREDLFETGSTVSLL